MDVQTSMPHQSRSTTTHQQFEKDFGESEEDLIENYRFLTKHCGVLRQSPTVDLISTIQKHHQKTTVSSKYVRPFTSISGCESTKNLSKPDSFAILTTKTSRSPLQSMRSKDSPTFSRIPPTIYYDDPIDENLNGHHKYRSFSIVKLFTRMKTRLKTERRYQAEAHHQLLTEEDPQEWLELTKNVRDVLTKALITDGGADLSTSRHHRRSSSKKSRERTSVLTKEFDDEEKSPIDIEIIRNAEEEEELDQITWQNFLTSSRGFHYRRNGVCKIVDRQMFQGQLLYFYGVANNILIDENLRASGLG